MVTKAIDGFAVVQRKHHTQGPFEVVGVGQDRTEAWKDALQQCAPFAHLDAKEFIVRNPQMKVVKATIRVTFDKNEALNA